MYQALPSRLHIKDSPVAGQGIFAKEDIPPGFVLGMSHLVVDEIIYRTPLGGFLNHSEEPNWFLRIRSVQRSEHIFMENDKMIIGKV